jgi:putative transposase
MPRRSVPLLAGEYYHIYNRGNNGQRVFLEPENYLFFLRRLRRYLRGEVQTPETGHPPGSTEVLPVGVTLVAYCLLPNHFHLLVRAHDDELSRRMQRFSISYTKAINERFQRTGALFEGQFQAISVAQDKYLLHLSRYVHLNPARAGLVKRAEDWEFSSYRDYLGLRRGTLPQPDVVLAQFPTPDAYRGFVESYVPRDRDIIAGLLFK